MSIDLGELRSLPPAEKLRLVELLWDDLGEYDAEIPLPEWVGVEAERRRSEMKDPAFGLSHEEMWARLGQRNG